MSVQFRTPLFAGEQRPFKLHSEPRNAWLPSRRQYDGEQRTISYQEIIVARCGFESHQAIISSGLYLAVITVMTIHLATATYGSQAFQSELVESPR